MPSTTGATASRARRALSWLTCGDRVIAVGMLLLVLYYVGTRGVYQGKMSGDGFFGFQYLNDAVFHRSLDMRKVIAKWEPYFGSDPITHRMPNRNPFGPVLAWMPFYLIAVGLVGLARGLHPSSLFGGKFAAAIREFETLPPDSAFHAWVAGLGTLIAVLIGWRFLYKLIDRRVGRTAARIGSTVAVWATPIAWYAVTQPFYQHGLAFGLVCILIERWDATYGDAGWRRFALLGAVGGFAMTMRAQEVLYLFLPSAEILVRLIRGPDRRRWFLGGVTLVATALVAFWPQVLVWRYYTGGLHAPQIEPLRLGTPMLVVALFSTRAGLFPWTPIAYASLAGILVAKKARRLTWALFAIFLVEVYICAAAWVPSGAYSFGARRLSDGAPLLGLGVALLWDRVAARAWARRAVASFCALCLLLCVFAMEMQRQRKTQSSGGYARTAGRYLADAGAPRWLQNFFLRVGYPFVQPMGWLYAIRHHVSASAFEGVEGNFLLDREGQWFTVLNKSVAFDQNAGPYVASGLAVGADAATVTGPVRVLLPMFAREPIKVQAIVTPPVGVKPAPVALRWNGQAIANHPIAAGFEFEVSQELVAPGTNELEMELPVGSRLKSLDFNSYTKWW